MRRLTKVWFNDDCKGTPGKALGMILGLPIITDDQVGLRVFEIENIGTIHEDVWIGHDGTLPYAVEKAGRLIGTTLDRCQQTDKIIVCPYPVYLNEHAICGFRTNTSLNCSIEARSLETDITRVAYQGAGEYCLTTSLKQYQYGNVHCDIVNSTFCFKPRIPARVGLIHLIDIHKRDRVDLNATDELRQNLGEYYEKYDTELRLLPEKLDQIRLRLATAHRTFTKVVQQTQEVKRQIREIKATNWWDNFWNWGSNIQIHPFVRLTSHVAVILILFTLVYLIVLTIQLRRWKAKITQRHNVGPMLEARSPLVL